MDVNILKLPYVLIPLLTTWRQHITNKFTKKCNSVEPKWDFISQYCQWVSVNTADLYAPMWSEMYGYIV